MLKQQLLKRGALVNSAGESRKDYILDRWVIIATGREKRPREFKKKEVEAPEAVDYFAPGNESNTPQEIGRIPAPGGGWKMRWFENKFPAMKPEGTAAAKTDNRFYTFADSYGYHEVIVETPDSKKQLAQLSQDEVEMLLRVYCERIKDLSSRPNVKYVNVFKNHGPMGGTSIVHSHSQIMTTNYVPQVVKDEINACRKFIECPYCKIIESEKKSVRKCFENQEFIAFAPYAARFNFECWIFPKKHVKTLKECNLKLLADILLRILQKINALGASYNYFLHYAPEGADLHFHIEVCPRIATWAGFELCTNTVINSISPEYAAKYYRGEIE
jgi:UDPglucose--hexose-1-phosphate uridylyltransferase